MLFGGKTAAAFYQAFAASIGTKPSVRIRTLFANTHFISLNTSLADGVTDIQVVAQSLLEQLVDQGLIDHDQIHFVDHSTLEPMALKAAHQQKRIEKLLRELNKDKIDLALVGIDKQEDRLASSVQR